MLGRLVYALAFVVVVPTLLVWWALASSSAVHLPALPVPEAGAALAALGLALVAAGMLALVRHGRGLPMNAFPPPVYVSRNVYRWVSHPIYLGFAMAVFGVSWWAASPSGTWLVSPVIMLAMAALVMGYERHELRRRFGPAAIHRPFFSLPPDESTPATLGEKTAVLLLLGIPWSLAFQAVCMLGPTRGSILANVVTGLLLWRLWQAGAAYSLIAGIYLMFGGVARFVEESYRGEPQTPAVAGLRLYQWLAVASLLAGIALTSFPSASPSPVFPGLTPIAWPVALLVAIVVGAAMGVDFPGSERRYGRLAPP